MPVNDPPVSRRAIFRPEWRSDACCRASAGVRELADARRRTRSPGPLTRAPGLVPLRAIGLCGPLHGSDALACEGPGEYPRGRGRFAGLQPREFSRCFFSGDTASRPLNYVARSTLFVSFVGHVHPLGRRVSDPARGDRRLGHEGDARRLKAGGIVALFPEGTRSPDGELGPLKPGIAVLAAAVRGSGRAGRSGRIVRELAAVAPGAGAASRQDSLRTTDLAR